MYKLFLSLGLIEKINITIQNKNLYIFTKRQLKNYILKEQVINEESDTFISLEIEDFNATKYDNIMLGRDIKFKNNKLNFVKNSRVQKIDYCYDFNDNLTIDINFKKRSLYFLKRLLGGEYSLNHSLFYQTVLYPIFSLYTIQDNYFLVHGSLVKIKEKYIVLTGLGGVGKSSLSNELVLQGAQILSDNFVLFNGNSFFGINMPIRLDLRNKTNKSIVYEDNNLKEALYEGMTTKPVKVEGVYFLTIADDLEISELDSDIMIQNWSLINNGADEILGANLFNLPFIYQNSIHKKINIENLKTYHFSIPRGKINEATKEIICQLGI